MKSSPTNTTQRSRANLLVLLGLAARDGERVERWCWLAFAVFVTWLASFFYMGMRPGGSGPLWVYSSGRDLLALCAFAVLLFGLFRAFRNKPFLRGRRGRAFLALVLVLGLAPLPFPYPSSHEGHPSSVQFRLPFDGEWRVLWGGDDKEVNRPAYLLAARRFGVSFAAASEDAPASGRPILAPAAGRVVHIDDSSAGGARGAAGIPGDLGNHIVLEVAPGQFAFLLPLQQGSAQVEVGARVESGESLGLVGELRPTLLATQPHLVMHLLDAPDAALGEPIPLFFHGYRAGGEPIPRGRPRGGTGSDGRPNGQLVAHDAP